MIPNSQYDVISIGGGLAGLAAAVAAREHGLTALVIEKSPLLGGVTAYSAGLLWVAGSHLEREAGIEDTMEAGAEYLRRMGMGFESEAHVQSYVRGAVEALLYFGKAIAARWQIVAGLPDYYFGRFPTALPAGRLIEVAPFAGSTLGEWRTRLRVSSQSAYRLTHADVRSLGGSGRSHLWDPSLLSRRTAEDELCQGTGLAATFLAGAIQHDVHVATSTKVASLVSNHGRVSGVRLENGTTITARRGVIIATSSYDWDSRSMRAFEGMPEVSSSTPPSVKGDHFELVQGLGARIVAVPKPIRLGYSIPDRTDDGHPMTGVLRAFSYPHGLLVNERGIRFCDESFYPDLGHKLKRVDGSRQLFENWPCWWVFDSQFRRKYSFASVSPHTPLPAEWNVLEADTLEGLAVSMGVPVDAFVAQIDRFNRDCAEGRDSDFGRGELPFSQISYGDPHASKHPNLGPVQEGPFFAMRPILVGLGIPTTGLDTDPVGRVLRFDGQPIPGLYAAGNSSALLEVGAGYQSGIANTRSLTVALSAVRDLI